MRTIPAITLFLSALLLACAPVSDTAQTAAGLASESDRLNAWFADRYEEQLQFSPIQLTFLGRKDQYDRIDDFSEQAQKAQLEWQRRSVEQMEKQFDYAALSAEAQQSYDVWKYQYEEAKRDWQYRYHDYVFEQMGGAQAQLPQFLLNFHRVDDASDMDAYISRIGEIARAIRQLNGHVKAAAKQGVRPPRFAYDGAVEQSEKLLAGQPFDASSTTDSPIWADVKSKIASLVSNNQLAEKQAKDYLARSRALLINDFGPTYQALIQWLKIDRSSAPESTHGASDLPDGDAYYTHKLRSQTTTDLSADEIHEIGLREVKRLRSAIEGIRQEVGFEGDLQDFFAFIRSDSQFFFPDTDEGRQGYIDGAEHFLGVIKQSLPDYFGLLPKADLVVKRVEAFREQDGAAQHYFAGTPDGSRPGIYYAHLSDMTAMPKNQMEVIAYHEGLPGHHMQISIAQELEGDLPQFRTQAHFTAYIEGWALYSELLAGEMGAYQDPYSKVGQYSSEIWRAIRLVVDTGLHAKGWTEEQAVEYFMANSPEPEESVRSEVQRYLVMPGQATSYKIGMLKILELRERAKAELGERFDIRTFHDVVLGGGALPLSILERRVQNWLDSQ